MRQKAKLGTLRGVSEWKQLNSAGDVKRFIKWCILSVRDQSLEPKTGAILAQMGIFLLKAVEVADLEQRMNEMEQSVTTDEHNGYISRPPVPD